MKRGITWVFMFRSLISARLLYSRRHREWPYVPSCDGSGGLRQSPSRHAVGEITDSGREIGGFVPLHDGAEIVVDEKSRPARAIGYTSEASLSPPESGPAS